MRKTQLLILLLVLLIGLANATEDCVPDNGYNICKSGYEYYKNALSVPQIMVNTQTFGQKVGDYYLKEAFISIKPLGTKAYWCENCIDSWSDVKCNKNGCYEPSSLKLIPSNKAGKLIIADSNPNTPDEKTTYTKCPIFISFEYDEDSQGNFAWSWVGYGWRGKSGCFDIKVADCTQDSDCSSGNVCDRNLCVAKVCDSGSDKCENFEQKVCENNKWVAKGTNIGVCGVECKSSSDCEGDNTEELYCYGKTLKERITKTSCSSYVCKTTTATTVKEECGFNCEIDKCIDAPVTPPIIPPVTPPIIPPVIPPETPPETPETPQSPIDITTNFLGIPIYTYVVVVLLGLFIVLIVKSGKKRKR